MGEEKNSNTTLRTYFIITLFGVLIFILILTLRLYFEKSLITYTTSWILLGTRGNYGTIKYLQPSHPLPEKYVLEILGDTYYRKSNYSDALSAYKEAIQIEPDNIIELKIALLETESGMTASGKTNTASGIKEILKDTMDRIEKDATERGKYMGNSTIYNSTPPSFNLSEKEIIDW